MALVEFKNVEKNITETITHSATSISVLKKGQVVVLLGPSGSGKSTYPYD